MTRKPQILIACSLLLVQACASWQRVEYPKSISFPTGGTITPDDLGYIPGDLEEIRWYGCAGEAEAETVLVLDFTIPGVATNTLCTFPLRRSFEWVPHGALTDGPGLLQRSFAADGTRQDRQGIGLLGSISIETEHAEEIAIKINLSWTANDASMGGVDVEIPSLIGLREEWALSDAVRLTVSYRKPAK